MPEMIVNPGNQPNQPCPVHSPAEPSSRVITGTGKRQTRNDCKAALSCIAIVRRHAALNDDERRLLSAIENEIRLAFNLEGAVSLGPLSDNINMDKAPEEWFW